MIAPFALLLAMLIPGPEVAPIWCSDYRDHGVHSLGVTRHLSSSGRYVSDSVSWNIGDIGESSAGSGWTLPSDARLSPRLDSLAFTFYLPHSPAGGLRARVEADGREVARLSLTPDVERYRGQYIVTIRLIRPPFPGLPPDGPVPEIGGATRVSMALEAADGTVLGTVLLPLPDWQAVMPAVEDARRRVIAKAADYRRQCSNLRIPIPMPPVPRP